MLTWLWPLVEGLAPVAALRTSTLLYPLLSGTHLLGLALLVGAIVALDIAILRGGAAAEAEWSPALRPVALAGFALAVATGLLLFAIRASFYAANPAFQIKLGLILLAGLNLALFRRAMSDGARRGLAAASILLWVGVLFAGRFIPYTL